MASEVRRCHKVPCGNQLSLAHSELPKAVEQLCLSVLCEPPLNYQALEGRPSSRVSNLRRLLKPAISDWLLSLY